MISPAGDKRGSNQVAVRQYNERLVLQTVRIKGPSSKAQIARYTGLTAQTVAGIISEFEDEGLLRRGQALKGKVGQPSIPFELNPNGGLAIGVHIGRRSTEVVLTNLTGNILARKQDVYLHPDPVKIARFVRGCRRQFSRRQIMKDSPLIGAGVCEPSGIGGWQAKLGAPQAILDAWQKVDFHAMLDDALDSPAVYCNDASAACAAELLFGDSDRLPNHLYVYIGSFVGGGLVINGNLFLGRTGNAGAIGSLPMRRADPLQLIDCASLIQLEAALVENGQGATALWQDASAWATHRPLVEHWITSAAPSLAMAVTSATALLELDGVVVDGAFPDWVCSALCDAIRAECETLNQEGISPTPLFAGRLGQDARALGSAALPLLSNFSPDHQSLLKA
ncbi:ROK family protein [Litorivicinus lipolyticus]|uniref:ROK family protein n=1 Tax=Litorivicinus lipolyticus TaxID=418701 RepID=A0A5Q2QFW9_9GAMM|nr:ROK family transcriptional regulator [Litorivicinus lipolyticus]QGG79905.1 ROK family protein [Litorivicinus lipolyticus]